MTNTNTTTEQIRQQEILARISRMNKRGPKPRLSRDDLQALIIRHHGNIKQIAAALGVTRNTVMKGIAREGLQAEVNLARRGWSIEVPEVEPAAAAAYPLAAVMTATREMLGERLAHGERPAVLQWLHFVRSLNGIGVLRPVDHAQTDDAAPASLNLGVINSLQAGCVTPDEVIVGYGDGARSAIVDTLVMVKPADLLRGLQRARREHPEMRITDFSGVLRSSGVDVVDGVPMLSPKRSRS